MKCANSNTKVTCKLSRIIPRVSHLRTKDIDLRVDFHCPVIFMDTHVNFTRVSKIEAMYGRSRVHVRVEPRSTLTLTRGLLRAENLRAYARINYASVEIHL